MTFISAHEQLNSTRHFHLITEPSQDVVIVWDMKQKKILYHSTLMEKYGYKGVCPPILNDGDISPNVHPEDQPVIWKLIRDVQEGKADITHELRLKDNNGNYIWTRCRFILQIDDTNESVKAIVIITDIDKIYKELEKLRRRAELDPLTGLYNKKETQVQIEEFLETAPSNTISALLILDVDNFKLVNDTKGHLYGDAALATIASIIKKQTRLTDIVGRVGGDEFAIFLKNIPTEVFALRKAEQILYKLKEFFITKEESLPVTCSIGISLFPKHINTYTDLFEYADIALYQAKKTGKNRAYIYDSKESSFSEDKSSSLTWLNKDNNSKIDIRSENLLDYIFKTLFDTDDIDKTMNMLLQIIGKRYDVSRIYIIENNNEGSTGKCRYEWCNSNIPSKKSDLDFIAYDNDYSVYFTENNDIFYCQDVSQISIEDQKKFFLTSVRSFLHCAIHEQYQFKGMVGFEECTGTHLWSQEDISMMSLVAKTLFLFLLKK